jgi:hypothetical protein
LCFFPGRREEYGIGLSTRIGSVTLKNPVIVTCGEHGRDRKTIAEVATTGVGAVTTKTIIQFPVPDPLPFYSLVSNGFLNCVLPAEQWFRDDIARAKKVGAPLIANLAGTSPAETADLARKAVAAGADIIELPTHCPHLVENLKAEFPGMKVPPPSCTTPRALRQNREGRARGRGGSESSCIYDAISVSIRINSSLCYGCELRVEMCAEGALSSPYYR